MEELIKIATKALQENLGFNEIILSDGKNTVHLIRYTPAPDTPYPFTSPYTWQNPFTTTPSE